jgi:hypothetical protein
MGIIGGGWCYKPSLQIIFVEAADVTSPPTNQFVGVAGDTSRPYKSDLYGRSGNRLYKSLICSNDFVGGLAQPPLQTLMSRPNKSLPL